MREVDFALMNVVQDKICHPGDTNFRRCKAIRDDREGELESTCCFCEQLTSLKLLWLGMSMSKVCSVLGIAEDTIHTAQGQILICISDHGLNVDGG